MNVTPFLALNCPLDGTPLRRSDASWRCSVGHCFDAAAQGYTNLLPVQNKRSRDPGDSKEMVAARRRFLESGAYQPIAAAVTKAHNPRNPPMNGTFDSRKATIAPMSIASPNWRCDLMKRRIARASFFAWV